MPFNNDIDWPILTRLVGAQASSFIHLLRNGMVAFNKWQSFRAGRTNAQLAAALSRTMTEIAEMDAAFAAIKELHDAADNVPVATLDRFFALRKFS